MAKDGRLYAKFTLDFPDSHKILPLSDRAFRALVEATIWSRKQKTDGFLASRLAVAKWGLEVLEELCHNDPQNPSLIEVENGYQIHDFSEHQDTRAEIEERTARNKIAGQKGGQARAKRSAKQPASEVLSEIQAETETETETENSGYVRDDRYVSNAREPVCVETAARPPKRYASSSAKTLVRQSLGQSHYPNATIDRLGIQVDKLLREGCPDTIVREAVQEWDRRPNCDRPEFLPTVYGDVVKRSRVKPTEDLTAGEAKVAGWAALAPLAPIQNGPKAINQ